MTESFQIALDQLNFYEWALLVLVVVLFLLKVIYLLFFTGRVAFFKSTSGNAQGSLSLILTVKNEEENLRKNLQSILSYKGANYEVVAIDNYSQDNSLTYILAMKDYNPRLRVSALNEEMRNSVKMAQNIALKAAKHDWVLVIPSSFKTGPDWLTEMVTKLDEQSEVVINYSNIQQNGTFLNMLFRVEFFFQQVQSFGFMLNNSPYVVTEENVAFRKQLFFKSGGYRGKISEPFANLELILNSVIREASAQLNLSPETIILKEEKVSVNRFQELIEKEFRLKSYLSSGKRFLLIIIDWINPLFLPVSALSIFLVPTVWPVVLLLVMVFVIGYLFIIRKIFYHLNERKLFLSSLLVALFLPYFKMLLQVGLNYYRRKKRWNRKK